MNILITGIGGPTPRGIAKSLRMFDKSASIIGTDAGIYGPGLYAMDIFDKTFLVPKSADDEDKYWKSMEEIIINERIDFAFIIPETEVLTWAKRQRTKELPCKALIPDYELANFMFDKFRLSQFLYDSGLSPKTVQVDKNQHTSFKDIYAMVPVPFWIRMNKTAGAIGALKISNENDFQAWSVLFKNYTGDVLASEYLPGRNYAVKVLYNHGKLVMAACAERIEYLLPNAAPSGISGMCSRGKLLNRPDLFYVSDSALRKVFSKFGIKPNGFFTVDLKENDKGLPLITEINLRPVSFNFAFALGGANFPLSIIRNLVLGSSIFSGFYNFNEELNFIRGVDYDLMVISDSKLKNS
ncbi:MAG: hypothetical protein IPM42_10345 [Saprospiraceae bacterium]|nr:hypothetical protein [Saprospiraceae bacterium]